MSEDLVDQILKKLPEIPPGMLSNLFYDSLEKATFSMKLSPLSHVARDMLREKPEAPELKIIFNMIEDFLPQATRDQRGTIEVFFFENFLNALTDDSPENKAPYKRFLSLLGPESRKLCQENDSFWGTKSPDL